MQVFWSVTLRYWVSSCGHFKGIWCLHPKCKDLESFTLNKKATSFEPLERFMHKTQRHIAKHLDLSHAAVRTSTHTNTRPV